MIATTHAVVTTDIIHRINPEGGLGQVRIGLGQGFHVTHPINIPNPTTPHTNNHTHILQSIQLRILNISTPLEGVISEPVSDH